MCFSARAMTWRFTLDRSAEDTLGFLPEQKRGEVLGALSSEKGWLSNRGALPDQQQLA